MFALILMMYATAKDGVVLTAEKRISSKLLEASTKSEKMYKVHLFCLALVESYGANSNNGATD